jgi:hypothetical protein
MTREPQNLDEALRALAAGELDALRPEQVARLEAILNASPEAAERVADVLPAADGRLGEVLRVAETESGGPTARQWEQMWGSIEGAGGTRQLTPKVRTLPPIVLRLWRPVAAVAACLLLAVLWKTAGPGRTVEPWPVQLATSVDINDFEVYDDSTPMIITSDDASGAAILWVLENES